MEIFVGVSGASGAIYAQRLLQRLDDYEVRIHVAFSRSSMTVARRELGLNLDSRHPDWNVYLGRKPNWIRHYPVDFFDCPPATGSHHMDGYCIVPCSTGMIGRVAAGASSCLISRAADVAIKERRRLVLITRETPLSEIHLENLLRLSRAGAVVMPASPGFYRDDTSIEKLVDFVIDRALVQLGVTKAGTYEGADPETSESDRIA